MGEGGEGGEGGGGGGGGGEGGEGGGAPLGGRGLCVPANTCYTSDSQQTRLFLFQKSQIAIKC